MQKKVHLRLKLGVHEVKIELSLLNVVLCLLGKHAFSDLHKDTQDGAFEVALKGTLEVALELHL